MSKKNNNLQNIHKNSLLGISKFSKSSLSSVKTRIKTEDGRIYYEQEGKIVEKEHVDKNRKIFLVKDDTVDNLLYKIYDYLYISSGDGANNVDEIKKHGITHIVNASNGQYKNIFKEGKDNKELGRNVKYLNVDLWDIDCAKISGYFEKCNEFIKDAIEESKNNKCLVHCSQGISRSSTLCLAHMMTIKNENGDLLKLEETLTTLKSIRKQIKPNRGFMKQLKQWEEKIEVLKG